MDAPNLEATALPVHVQLLSKAEAPQPNCPLFTTIPPEIRNKIFAFALSDDLDHDYHDPEYDQYDDSCFLRRKTDTRLLRTCRAIYRETWALPFLLREHMYWLDRHDPQLGLRGPAWLYRMGSRLHDKKSQFDAFSSDGKDRLKDRFARFDPKYNNNRVFEIPCLEVFASVQSLEYRDLAHLLSTPHLNPRKLVITIPLFSETWKEDVNQALGETALTGQWICTLRKYLPSSVQEIVIRLEAYEGRKSQLDYVVEKMREKWFFRREDRRGLYVDVSEEVDVATRVELEPWTHNECARISRHPLNDYYNYYNVFKSHLACPHPNCWPEFIARHCRHSVVMKYYSATVRFLPAKIITKKGGRLSPLVKEWSRNETFHREEERRRERDSLFRLDLPSTIDGF